MLHPNFYTSSSSRRCSRVLRCHSSASRWAILRHTSPGHSMDFLFHKTTGKTSNFPCTRLFGGPGIPNLDLLLFTLFLSPDEKFMALKIDERCTRGEDYSRLLTPRYYARSSGNHCESGASIQRRRRIPWESLDRPLRASILWTNWEENYQSRCSVWTFLKAGRIPSDRFNRRSHKSKITDDEEMIIPRFRDLSDDYRRRQVTIKIILSRKRDLYDESIFCNVRLSGIRNRNFS